MESLVIKSSVVKEVCGKFFAEYDTIYQEYFEIYSSRKTIVEDANRKEFLAFSKLPDSDYMRTPSPIHYEFLEFFMMKDAKIMSKLHQVSSLADDSYISLNEKETGLITYWSKHSVLAEFEKWKSLGFIPSTCYQDLVKYKEAAALKKSSLEVSPVKVVDVGSTTEVRKVSELSFTAALIFIVCLHILMVVGLFLL